MTSANALETRSSDNPVVYQQAGGGEVSLSLDDIRRFLCPDATMEEAMTFLKVCQYQGLNPFIGDVYLVVYTSRDGTRNTSIITGKDTFTKRAQRHPQFEGFRAGIVVESRNGEVVEREGTLKGQNEKLIGGWAEVYRTDRRFPFKTTVNFSEYNTGRRNWQSMPGTMIRKVALVQSLREAFPEDLGNLYDSSEMRISIPEGGQPVYDEALPSGRPQQPTIVDHSQDRVIEYQTHAAAQSGASAPADSQVSDDDDATSVKKLLIQDAFALQRGEAIVDSVKATLQKAATKGQWEDCKAAMVELGIPSEEVVRLLAEDARLRDIVKNASGAPKVSTLTYGQVLRLEGVLREEYDPTQAPSETGGIVDGAVGVMAPPERPETIPAPDTAPTEEPPTPATKEDGDKQPPAPPAPPVEEITGEQQQAGAAVEDPDFQRQLPFD